MSNSKLSSQREMDMNECHHCSLFDPVWAQSLTQPISHFDLAIDRLQQRINAHLKAIMDDEN